ncbi:MAG TPA: TolC family protein [Thermoanaerobaculia bacterium]|nr:TolC family protein [Thermoanaerobaculia bacterium]
MKRLTTAVLLLLAPAITSAQTKLTFDGALQRALEVNNSVERSRHEVGIAKANKELLLSAVMPRITATGNLQRNSISESFGGGDDEVTILPRNNWDYRITISQPVFAGRRELRAYSQSKLNISNAQEGLRQTEDAALLRVASSYLAIVNADRRMEIENRNIELADKRLVQAKAFYDAGEVTKVDVFRAETARKAAQRLLAAAQQTREHAVSLLREDLDLDGAVEVETPANVFPVLPAESELLARAESSRPEIAFAKNNVRIASLEVSKQRGFWLPTVLFDGGWINQKTSFPADHYAYGALRFNIPLFQAGEVIARVAGAKEREKQAEIALEEAKIAVREDVHTALADLQTAETSLGLANEQLAAAEAEYAQAFDLYRAQEATSLDLASSETSLADARRAVAEETLNRDLASLRVWFTTGTMKHTLGLAPAKESR